jgi:hypothetical protein
MKYLVLADNWNDLAKKETNIPTDCLTKGTEIIVKLNKFEYTFVVDKIIVSAITNNIYIKVKFAFRHLETYCSDNNLECKNEDDGFKSAVDHLIKLDGWIKSSTNMKFLF